jgi:hypothetical protein
MENKTALELVTAKVSKNQKRFGHVHDSYYKDEQLLQAALFTLQPKHYEYPKDWDKWYERKVLKERNDIKRYVNAAALLIDEIDRRLNLEDSGK